jgi:hypothetical protein
MKRCYLCKMKMQWDLDSQGRLYPFCANPECTTQENLRTHEAIARRAQDYRKPPTENLKDDSSDN